MTAKIIVEGWRFLPHSFATVNQFQCLEMLRRPGIQLYHRDLPYWNRKWQPSSGLFSDAEESALRAIPPAPDNLKAGAILRYGCPFDFSPGDARRTVTFATCEFGRLSPEVLAKPENGIAPFGPDVTVVTPSRWSRDGLIRSGIDAARIRVVPHGIAPDIFCPPYPDERAVLRRKFGWEGAFVFLHISAMTPNKGIPLILKSLYELAQCQPRAHLVLKGLDSLYASTNALNECLKTLPAFVHPFIKSRVAYTGGDNSYRDIANLYKAADAYVAPYSGEGFNLPVLEAAACGLPVICTAGGPTDDFTTPDFSLHVNSKLAFSGAPKNPEMIYLQPEQAHLAALMQQVIEDNSWRESARTAGPVYIHEHFTWKRVVDRLETELRD